MGISGVYQAKMHTLDSSMEEMPLHNKRKHLLFSGVNDAYCTSQHKWQKAMVLRDTCLNPVVIVSLGSLVCYVFLCLCHFSNSCFRSGMYYLFVSIPNFRLPLCSACTGVVVRENLDFRKSLI